VNDVIALCKGDPAARVPVFNQCDLGLIPGLAAVIICELSLFSECMPLKHEITTTV